MSVIMYEELLKRMLDRVPDTVDKREGSIIYDALAPAAAELVQAYVTLESYLDLVFVDTSSGEHLTRLCSQFGIDRQSATYAIRKATFKDGQGNLFNVPVGSRYTIDTLAYCVTDKMAEGEFKVKCETAGAIGNTSFGNLIPADYVAGLATAILEDVLIPGEEEESDSQLKERYFEYVREPAFGGNIADYKRKVKELNGIGAVKVFPVWNGDGTVKLVILDSAFNIPSSTLIEYVKNEVAPDDGENGLGIAPIGHSVTVVGAGSTVVNIGITITLASGYSKENVTESIRNTINEYICTIRESWEENETLIVRLAHVDSRALDVEGVLDVASTTINGTNSNLQIEASNVPVLGEVVVTYAT